MHAQAQTNNSKITEMYTLFSKLDNTKAITDYTNN